MRWLNPKKRHPSVSLVSLGLLSNVVARGPLIPSRLRVTCKKSIGHANSRSKKPRRDKSLKNTGKEHHLDMPGIFLT